MHIVTRNGKPQHRQSDAKNFGVLKNADKKAKATLFTNYDDARNSMRRTARRLAGTKSGAGTFEILPVELAASVHSPTLKT